MNWNDWFEKQIAKPENKLPIRIRTMHSLYGIREGEKCGDCKSFYKRGNVAGTYYKCKKNKITHGSGTDWRVNWIACGKFEKGESE